MYICECISCVDAHEGQRGHLMPWCYSYRYITAVHGSWELDSSGRAQATLPADALSRPNFPLCELLLRDFMYLFYYLDQAASAFWRRTDKEALHIRGLYLEQYQQWRYHEIFFRTWVQLPSSYQYRDPSFFQLSKLKIMWAVWQFGPQS